MTISKITNYYKFKISTKCLITKYIESLNYLLKCLISKYSKWYIIGSLNPFGLLLGCANFLPVGPLCT